jgi:hypothetical protein
MFDNYSKDDRRDCFGGFFVGSTWSSVNHIGKKCREVKPSFMGKLFLDTFL